MDGSDIKWLVLFKMVFFNLKTFMFSFVLIDYLCPENILFYYPRITENKRFHLKF